MLNAGGLKPSISVSGPWWTSVSAGSCQLAGSATVKRANSRASAGEPRREMVSQKSRGDIGSKSGMARLCRRRRQNRRYRAEVAAMKAVASTLSRHGERATEELSPEQITLDAREYASFIPDRGRAESHGESAHPLRASLPLPAYSSTRWTVRGGRIGNHMVHLPSGSRRSEQPVPVLRLRELSLTSFACALGVAVVFLAIRRYRRRRRIRLKAIMRALFPRRIASHPSTLDRPQLSGLQLSSYSGRYSAGRSSPIRCSATA